MSINFVSLIFIWLLQLQGSSGQNMNVTEVTTGTQVTGNGFTLGQTTRREESTSSPLSEGSAGTITPPMTVDPKGGKYTEPNTKPSLPTTPSQTVLPDNQTAATPPNPTSSQINSSTAGTTSTTGTQFKVTTSAAAAGATSHTSIPTTTTWAPSMQSSSTQSQYANDTTAHPSPGRTQSTNISSTTSTSTKPDENKSTSGSPGTADDATPSTGLYKTSMSTTKRPFIHIVTTNGRQDPPEKNANSPKGTSDGKVVAGLIGGALILMMVGFLVIFIKKRKLQKRQITTSDWAGPSPFLEGGPDNGEVTLRSSNQISLSSFLPQRLSKRFSMLPDTEEDTVPGTTFGDHQGSSVGGELEGNDVKGSNGTVVVVPDVNSTGGAPETVENSVLVTSSETNQLLSTNNNSEAADHNQDDSENPLILSGAVEKPQPQMNEGFEQP